ncbi:MAG TPA: Kdo hydroxylase family protein [Myxococcaceae bacterium]|nr:Kdo hydroxylase family protein [Myxococcaceae bacterium]
MLLTVSGEELEKLVPERLADALERGRVVFFPKSPVLLPSDADLAFLREKLGTRLLAKNVSYYPEARRLTGIKADPAVAARTLEILESYSRRVGGLLRWLMPRFMASARLGTTSFRPLQEQGRNLSPHASNELVHVDAGAYGATHGDRILRFFTNVNPSEERVWITNGTFADLYQRHAKEAGIAGNGRVRVEEKWVDRAYSTLVRAASRWVPLAKVIDSSPYDRAMRRFHNYMKDTPAFQRESAGQLEMRFPPFSSWMVLTDAVSHACRSGQYALVDTFLVPLANCQLRQYAPYEILRRSSAAIAAEP